VDGHEQGLSYSPRELKIIITSTPKTGNTWLRHLLAAIYDLPTVKLGFPFDPDAASALGVRWIMHQHYTAEPVLLDWARQNNAVLITTTRHPGDVLVSLYHYVRSFNHLFNFYQLAELAADDGTFGAPVRSVVQTVFRDIVGISVAWLSAGARTVSYEALYFDPVAALTALTNAIYPVSRDCIERAVERCDIRVMRALDHENSGFFREGGCGGWRHALPADIIELLRTVEPYPTQFAALGYTLDPQDVWSEAWTKRPSAKAAFFDQHGHSPATTSLLKTIYLSFDSAEAARRWPDIASAPTTFHAWLNAPANADPYTPAAAPMITNIAAHIHRTRTDVSAVFPDLYGQHRVDFVLWLIEHAARDYHLDDAYIAPLRLSLADWATRPDANDPVQAPAGGAGHATAPILTNLAAYVYSRRPDLRAAFPDPYGRHRIDLALWLIEHAPHDYHLDDACVAPLRLLLIAWAVRPNAHDPAHAPAGGAGHATAPTLTNLAAYVYSRRPDLRAAFPDPYGRHRIDFVLWLIEHAPHDYHLDDTCVAPLRQQFLAWALGSDGPISHRLNIAANNRRRSPAAHQNPDRYGDQRFAYLSLYILGHKRMTRTPIGMIIRGMIWLVLKGKARLAQHQPARRLLASAWQRSKERRP
jgi:hypothetical protein